MSIDDEAPGGGISVTIKYGKGFESTWSGFKGSLQQVRENVAEFFGLDHDMVQGMTLAEVVLNATSVAHGLGNVSASMGGHVISTSPSSPATSPAPAGDVWAQAGAASKPAESSVSTWLKGEIDKIKDVTALKRLYAENKAAFEADTALTDHWKAQGAALKAAQG
ncbi:hypothetical protein FHR83_007123 [Actinoplanes campanulatus]|uniref:Uncharacterized protein n=1 Tax=Actinoplanes campanulatus TaxID=113559 RepID=A0A7W5FID4_9ACTN|nr:hypothetical protein [Actinoplanes campanulatus]MBB3099417.1 hypothetical protein [Actinoplanes campanulatus]GGN40085.1 hypothetical protein GCM10010109_68690 [Actinoplanes campanulatus]GID42374.1 hypothetical protein Aca09nite_88800 [Actinoplanes campanulatus]